MEGEAKDPAGLGGARHLAFLVPRLEAHGVAGQVVTLFLGQGRNQRGIDPAGEQQPDRDVGQKLALDPLAEQVVIGLDRILDRALEALDHRLDVAGEAMRHGLEVDHQEMARRQAMDPLPEGVRRGHEAERQEGLEGVRVDAEARLVLPLEGPDLGGEDQAAIRHDAVIDRLDAEGVAGEIELARLEIDRGEGEHAVQAGDGRRHAVGGEAFHQRLGIGMAAPVDLELTAEVQVIVDLAVIGHPPAAVPARHRLMAGCGKVEDGEPGMAEEKVLSRGVQALAALAVRAPMAEQCDRPLGVERMVDAAENAAHRLPLVA
jgi:hypothetical protein